MRLLSVLAALFFLSASDAIRAQEPPLPKPDTQDAQATPSPENGASVAATPPQLIPPLPLPPEIKQPVPPNPNTPTIPQLDAAFKQTPISVAAENARHHVEWRDLRNQLVSDPEVIAALAAAGAAHTDLEKRKRLHKYYEIYFGKMIVLAATPELKAYLTARRDEEFAGLAQPRVRPVSPTPTPKPAR